MCFLDIFTLNLQPTGPPGYIVLHGIRCQVDWEIHWWTKTLHSMKYQSGGAGGLVHQLPNPKPLMTDQATVTTPSETKAHPAVPSPWVYQCGTTPQANPPQHTLEPLRCTKCFFFSYFSLGHVGPSTLQIIVWYFFTWLGIHLSRIFTFKFVIFKSRDSLDMSWSSAPRRRVTSGFHLCWS